MILKHKFELLKNCFFLCYFLFFGCALTAKDSSPYLANGEFVFEESENYELAGLDLYLLNKTEKQISSFTIVFYLFDEDGNIPQGVKNSIVMNINAEVDPMDSLSTCINLDGFVYEIPEQQYLVDYLYLSEIKYADGTVWKDPFGQNMF